MVDPKTITEAEAFRIIVRALKEAPDEACHYGYDCYLRDVIDWYLRTMHKMVPSTGIATTIEACSPPFMDAAFALVRLGVLRPGVVRIGRQVVDDGGTAFSLTGFGRTWLADPEHDPLPSHPAEMGALLGQYRDNFGDAFHQRAQEAVKCQLAGAWLATCVMAGAAAEAILIAIAAAKSGDEEQVLKELRAAGGRAKLQKAVTAPLTESDRRALDAYLELLKPWRDVSAHGAITAVGAFEAFEALTRLMRLAIFAKDHWAQLSR